MMKKGISYKGNTFYKLMLCFFIFTFVSILSLAAVYINNIYQSNKMLKKSYDDMAEKMADNFQHQVIDYYQFAGETILGIEALQPLLAYESLENAPELEEFMMEMRITNFFQTPEGDLIFLYLKNSGETIGPSGRVTDRLEPLITQRLGITMDMWTELTQTGREPFSFFVITDQMDFGRLMIAKEISPGLVYIGAYRDSNIHDLLDSYYIPDDSEVLLNTPNNSHLSLHYGMEHPDYEELSYLIGHSEHSLVYNDTTYFKYETFFAENSIRQTILIPDNISARWNYILLSVILIAALLLVLGTVLSHFIASRIYRPIQTLIQKLPIEETDKNGHEFLMIDKVVQALHEKTMTYEQRISMQNKLLADSLLLRLMKRDLTYSGEIEQALKNADFPVDLQAYTVLFIQPEMLETDDRIIDQNTFTAICRDVFERLGYFVFLIEELGYFVAVLDLGNREAELFQQLVEIHKALSEKLNIPATVACSEIHHNIIDLPTAYAEAHLTLEQSILIGEYGTVKHFSRQEENWQKKTIGQQLVNKAMKLIQYIQVEDYDQVKQCLQEMFQYLSEHEPQSVGILQKQIRYILDTIAFAENYQEIPHNDLSRLLNQSAIAIDKNNLKKIFQKIYLHFDKTQKNYLEQTGNHKVINIPEYIKKNSADPNLSAGAVAEHFNISVSWMSNLLKRELNTSFLDCLHKSRIENAKALILKTENTIHDIAEMVGYSNSMTMIRAFKRYEGVTPGWYRASK